MPDVNLSRRHFLKLLGLGGVVATLGVFSNFAPQNMAPRQASAQSLGAWTLGANLPFPTVHVALLKNGKIMTTPGSGWQQTNKQGPFNVSVIDLVANTRTDSTVADDLFCCGFAQLTNGNIVITGGTTSYADGPDGKYHGGKFAYEFDVNSTTWNKISDMAHGRWYPAMGTLPNGKVYVMTGLDEWGTENDLTEIYDPVTKTFSIKYNPNSSITYTVGAGNTTIPPGTITPTYGGPGQGVNPDISFYARSIIMPSGLLFITGMRQKVRLWNYTTGVWSLPPYPNDDMLAAGRTYGTAVLLPLKNISSERGKVIVAGGNSSGGIIPTNTAEIFDFNAGTNTNPIRSSLPSMNYGRMYLDPVILPTGKVIMFGGTSGNNVNSVLVPEMFDPDTSTWTNLPAASVGRFYHSASLLLPDGRVWVSSGTPNMIIFEARTEFYSPWYMFAGTRPTISGEPTFQRVNNAPYSGTITIPTTPDGLDISAVSLLRLGNVTHHFDAEHRCVWLASSSVPFVSKSSSNVIVNAPINANIAPPGYYMIHILDSLGVPSIAKIIQIGAEIISGPDNTPPIIGITSPSARAPIVGPSSGVQVTVSGTAQDASSGIKTVRIKIDSGAEIPVNSIVNNYELWSVSTTITTQGPHKIKAIATDNADNVSSVEIPITIFFS